MSHTKATVAVFAHRGDAGAVTLTSLLRRRAHANVILVAEDTVARAVIAHRPSSGRWATGSDSGALAGDRLRLPDGQVIDSSTEAVVWRLSTLPTPTLPAGHRDYADAEGYALGLSWLHGLGDALVNRPDSRALAGSQPDLLHLAHLARVHDVAMAAFTLSADDAMTSSRLPPRSWADSRTPIEVPGGCEDDGPRLPLPRLRAESLTRLGTVLVLGDVVVAPQDGTELRAFPLDRLATLVRAVGLTTAEVSLASRHHDGAIVMTGLQAVPLLQDPVHTAAFADFVEARASARLEAVAA